MALFGKKSTAEEFGATLRLAYIDMYKHALSKLNERADSGITWPEDLENEVAALIYFAFDLGMSSGSETILRNRIRDGFLAASPPPKEIAKQLADRCDEYAGAMRVADREQGMLALGRVFADHTGQGPNIYVVMQAIIHFRSSYNMVAEQVSKTIGTLR